MVGNDVVDLARVDKNAWKRNRFLQKVLVSSEMKMLTDSSDPGSFLWRLWSMKESAYKLHFRTTLRRSLNPTHYVCEVFGETEGRVHIGSSVYSTRSLQDGNCVHTLAFRPQSITQLTCGTVKSSSAGSLRNKIINDLIHSYSLRFDLPVEAIAFKKDENGLPFLNDLSSGQKEPCSISHHGEFGAYALSALS